MKATSCPVVIVGAGPGGCACALQLQRYGHQFLLLEKNRIGGLAVNARRIENLVGMPGGISGRQFCERMGRQLKEAGIRVIFQEVLQVERESRRDDFDIRTADHIFRARSLVLATGSRPRWPGVARPEIHERIFSDLEGLGERRGEEIAVMGGGDLAFDYALSLAGTNRVILLARRSAFPALPLLVREARAHPRIELLAPAEVRSLDRVDGGLRIHLAGREDPLQVDCLLVAVGREPDQEILPPGMAGEKENNRREPRLFIVGDARNPYLRQISIAAGDGLRAAMILHRQWDEVLAWK